MHKRLINYVHQHQLFNRGNRLLLAISGGLDSVVLADLLHQSGFVFGMAHVNFGLRGAESNRDEMFVRQLATQYGATLSVAHFDAKQFAATEGCSVQVAARKLRYDWFDRLTSSNGGNETIPTHILTAHHADDNTETLLMNFFKGTGISGLRGILPRQGKLVRPMLCFTREEIMQYATEKKLAWVEDSSNESDAYTRNYFRHQVIPLVEAQFPAVMQNLQDNALRFRDIELLYRRQVALAKKQLLEQKGNEVHIPVLKLQKTVGLRTILYEIITEYGFTALQTDEVLALLNSETGKYVASATHRVIKHRYWLIIAPQRVDDATIFIAEGEGTVALPGGEYLRVELLENQTREIVPAPEVALLDADLVQFPLLIRGWKSGDYLYPLGMRKKKKVSRLLSDLKRSMVQKEHTRVVEMNRKLLWVINERIDDRFKITPATTRVLRLTYAKKKGG